MRDALGMLEQVASFAGSPVSVEAARRVLGLARGDALRAFIDALSARDAAAGFSVLEDLVQEGADLRQFLSEVLFDLRGALLARVGAESAIVADVGPDESEWLGSVAKRWAPSSLAAALKEFAELDAPGLDERQLLIRLELAVANVAGFDGDDAGARDPARTTQARALEQGVPDVAASAAGRGTPRHGHETPDSTSHSAGAYEMVAAPEPGPPAFEAQEDETGKAAAVPGAAAPSLAAVEGRWQTVLDGYVGNLLDKVLLARVQPMALEGGVLTLGGRLDALELRQIESCRKALETRLTEEFRTTLRVRFGTDDSPPAGTTGGPIVAGIDTVDEGAAINGPDELPAEDHLPVDDESGLSLIETAVRMFGGEIVPEPAEAGHASDAVSVPYDDHGS
jgi:DNA polymerase-3 subunit gamma/tau